MTLQQLEYITAIDRYGYFVAAAEACGVTQSTLSLMVRRLEDELDVRIFNRDSHPVEATEAGRKIIDHAKMVLYHRDQLLETTKSDREQASGMLRIALISSVAPVLIPGLFRHVQTHYPAVDLSTEEMLSSTIMTRLRRAEIDMGIVTSPVTEGGMLEIPLYHEAFVAYVSPREETFKEKSIPRDSVLDHPLWIMKDGVRLLDRSKMGPDDSFRYDTHYEGGRVGLLVQLINENGGMGIIPETHVGMILLSQQVNIRPIVDPVPSRTVSLVIRQDFIREGMLNVVVEAIRTVIPARMLDPVILSGKLKL